MTAKNPSPWEARQGCCDFPKSCLYHEGYENGYLAAAGLLEQTLQFGEKAAAEHYKRRIEEARR